MKFSALANFHPKQVEATKVADAHRYTLFGGSRGPGKSYWLRFYLLRLLLIWGAQGHKGVRVMLGCEDYPSLWERQITKVQLQFPAFLGTLQLSPHPEFRLASRYGSGVLAFRNLDDPTKYQSAEFAAIGIDELTKNPVSTFDVLRGSLRWPGITATRFVAASNSNGVGQKWVRAYFLEHEYPDELRGRSDDFAYVLALPDDNPYLPGSYWEELNTLSGALRRSWLLADWYAQFEGLVYDEFGAENVTDEEPDAEAPIELAFDDGYIDPRAILFIQRKSTHILVFDELYHSRHLGAVCVGEVVERCKARGWPTPQIAVGSPEAVELREVFRQANIPCRVEPHKIVEGIQVVRRLVRDGQGYRSLRVHKRCTNLLREMREGYRYPEGDKPRRNEEVPLDQDNHASDALRYWCWVRSRR